MEFRHSVQLIFLFIMLFAVGAFCSLKMGVIFVSCPLGVLQTMAATRLFLLAALVSSLVLIIVTILTGRLFCGWICPIGTILEHGGKLVPRTSRRLPLESRNIKYGLLAAIILGAAIFRYAVFCSICPIGVACRAVSFRGLVLSPELLVLLFLLLAEAYERRFWCKYLCPVGALLGLIAKFKIYRLKINPDKCVTCKRCLKECKNNQMDILCPELFEVGLVRNDECNFCLQCVESCTKNAIEVVSVFDKKKPPQNKGEELLSKI